MGHWTINFPCDHGLSIPWASKTCLLVWALAKSLFKVGLSIQQAVVGKQGTNAQRH